MRTTIGDLRATRAAGKLTAKHFEEAVLGLDKLAVEYLADVGCAVPDAEKLHDSLCERYAKTHARQLYLYACDVGEWLMSQHEYDTPELKDLREKAQRVIDLRRRDVPQDKIVAARVAAGVAAGDAAGDAARVAAWDAAWVAAWDAAWVAAWDAAWVAAWHAAWSAAWSAGTDAIYRKFLCVLFQRLTTDPAPNGERRPLTPHPALAMAYGEVAS